MRKTRSREASSGVTSASVTPQSEGSLTASAGGAVHAADRQGDPMAAEERQHRIAVAAYYRAECRGFRPGCEMDDWLEAEAEIGKRADTRSD